MYRFQNCKSLKLKTLDSLIYNNSKELNNPYIQQLKTTQQLPYIQQLKRNFLCLNPGVRSSLHVFDHTIKPILMYCSEIWGPINQLSSRFLRKPSITVDEIFSKLLCNNLHIKFCKSILGVHRKSSNFAVLSELGRHPLHYDILKQSFVYFQRLNTLGNSFPPLKAAFNCSYSNYLANKTLMVWLSNIFKK